MSKPIRLLEVMRKVLQKNEIEEIPAAGEFILSAEDTKCTTLFCGSVYGFAVQLNNEEKINLFREAKERGLNRLNSAEDFKPIENELYPLYWGKDKQLGARPYQHLNNPSRTGAIRLSTYKSLLGKKIECVSLTVKDYEKAERAMQYEHHDLLKTTTKKQ